MTEPVKVRIRDGWAYVLAADYARLEQECERLREFVMSMLETAFEGGDVLYGRYEQLEQENAALCKRARIAEREAMSALKALKGLERVARVVSDHSDQVCGELNVAKQLLAQCQEHLHPHRDAVLWGVVCDLLQAKPC